MTINTLTLRNVVCVHSALTIDHYGTVAQALNLMDYHQRHAIGVTVNQQFKGLFTRSDFINRIASRYIDPRRTVVGMVMTVNPVVVSADSGIKETYYLMCYDDYSHFPVMDYDTIGGKCLGIISEQDLRKHIAADLEKENLKSRLMDNMLREPYGACASN